MSGTKTLRAGLAILIIASTIAGCRTMTQEHEAPTLTVSELARDLARGPASFKGRTVRVCRGRLDQIIPTDHREWAFSAIGERFPHGAGVNVKACGDAAPIVDSQGCLTGRVARPDGSIAEPAPDEGVIVSTAIHSYTWYLHEICRP